MFPEVLKFGKGVYGLRFEYGNKYTFKKGFPQTADFEAYFFGAIGGYFKFYARNPANKEDLLEFSMTAKPLDYDHVASHRDKENPIARNILKHRRLVAESKLDLERKKIVLSKIASLETRVEDHSDII